jgi:DNA-binding MarR family transcriptional regulator
MDDITRPSRFDTCIAAHIEQAYRHLEHVYERLVAPTGLSVLEWYTLRALYAEDGLSASRLAALVCRHPSSMTALLNRMQQRDLLRREVDPADRRSVRVYLTERGRAQRPQVEQVAARLDSLFKDQITAEQLDTFLHVLLVLQSVPANGG